MNPFIKGALMVLSLGFLVIGPYSVAGAASGKVTVETLRGPLVNAWFSTTDPSGCIQTDTFVTANRSTEQQQAGQGVTTGVGAVSIFKYDACSGTILLQGIGQTDTLGADELDISNQLDRATLHTTMAVTNIDTGEVFDVTVDVAWVGTSDITRDHSNTNDRYPGGCHVLNRWKGSGREAVASGAVSDGVTTFTSVPAQSAEIGYVIDGFEVIGCL